MTKRKLSSELLDKFFFQANAMLGIGVFLECGAHEASASRTLSSQGCKCYALEANPETFKEKTSASEEMNFFPINLGIADKKGKLNFFIPKEDRVSGIATLKPKKDHHYDQIEIGVTTIDDFIKEKHLPLFSKTGPRRARCHRYEQSQFQTLPKKRP